MVLLVFFHPVSLRWSGCPGVGGGLYLGWRGTGGGRRTKELSAQMSIVYDFFFLGIFSLLFCIGWLFLAFTGFVFPFNQSFIY